MNANEASIIAIAHNAGPLHVDVVECRYQKGCGFSAGIAALIEWRRSCYSRHASGEPLTAVRVPMSALDTASASMKHFGLARANRRRCKHISVAVGSSSFSTASTETLE